MRSSLLLAVVLLSGCAGWPPDNPYLNSSAPIPAVTHIAAQTEKPVEAQESKEDRELRARLVILERERDKWRSYANRLELTPTCRPFPSGVSPE